MDINGHGGKDLSSLVDSLASDCPSDMDTVCRHPEFKDRMKTFLSKAKTLDGADCKDQSTCRMYQNRALQEFEEIVLSPILFSNCPQASDLCKNPTMHFKKPPQELVHAWHMPRDQQMECIQNHMHACKGDACAFQKLCNISGKGMINRTLKDVPSFKACRELCHTNNACAGFTYGTDRACTIYDFNGDEELAWG